MPDLFKVLWRRTNQRDWKEWCNEAVTGSARAAFGYSKLPMEWRPTEVLSRDGVVIADPSVLLDQEVDKYGEMWQAKSSGERLPRHQSREHLPRLEPDFIRQVSRSYKVTAARSYDGLHMRHFSLLGDDALKAWALMIEVTEMVGILPQQLRKIMFSCCRSKKGVSGR